MGQRWESEGGVSWKLPWRVTCGLFRVDVMIMPYHQHCYRRAHEGHAKSTMYVAKNVHHQPKPFPSSIFLCIYFQTSVSTCSVYFYVNFRSRRQDKSYQ